MDRNQYLCWTRASILEHFRTKVLASSGSTKPEVKIDMNDNPTVDDIIVMMDIDFKDITKVEKEMMISVTLIIRTLENQGIFKTDLYKGFVLEGITGGIPIYRYGPEGDQSYFGCLIKMSNSSRFTEYGQETTGPRLTIATCQVDYSINFTI